jgi:hypothetical protein
MIVPSRMFKIQVVKSGMIKNKCNFMLSPQKEVYAKGKSLGLHSTF